MKQSKKPLFCQFHVDVLLREHQVPQVPHNNTIFYAVTHNIQHGDVLCTIMTHCIPHSDMLHTRQWHYTATYGMPHDDIYSYIRNDTHYCILPNRRYPLRENIGSVVQKRLLQNTRNGGCTTSRKGCSINAECNRTSRGTCQVQMM